MDRSRPAKVQLTYPNEIEAEMGCRVSLPAIASDKGDFPSRGGLERHQETRVDGIQRSNRHIFLNHLRSPIQDQSTHFHQLPPCTVTSNPTQQRHENPLGQSPSRLRLDKPDQFHRSHRR